jgi:hypothetical protein
MTRHETLCGALRQLGPSINTISTMRVVEVCRENLPDADDDEIMQALNAMGQEYMREAKEEDDGVRHAADLTPAELKQVCDGLYEKAEVALLEAALLEAKVTLADLDGSEVEPTEEKKLRANAAQYRAAARGHVEHIVELLRYWLRATRAEPGGDEHH